MAIASNSALDMSMRLMPIDPQHQNTVAPLHGPVALFAIEPGNEDADEGAVDGGASDRIGVQ